MNRHRRLYEELKQLTTTPSPDGHINRGDKVYAGTGKMVGRATGTHTVCAMAGCTGRKYSVVWSDGTMTRCCSKGMKIRKDGWHQIG